MRYYGGGWDGVEKEGSQAVEAEEDNIYED